ncbi:hypothetical protein BHE90_004477 [Fusarium euwallaceae]|uniref:Uncharacterized protein n=1 Tax=Fusarium euwallaceae TaxID=1147111 RepID=A0A430LZ77_9HYPO|nr:hypothetical protein BHE90_004477 [Fusarium euwallaceae]
MAIRKAPQATQYELNDLASDNGRLARAYRAGHHPPSRTTVVSTQPLLAQTNSSRSRPRPRGQLAPQARLGNQPIPASTPSFSPQFRHWTPQRASDTAAGLSLLAGGSIIDMTRFGAFPCFESSNTNHGA